MADKYIPEHRRTTFKAKSAFKPDELRRAKREENLAKRRGIAGRDQPGASLGAAPDSDDEGGNIESQVRPFRYTLPHYHQFPVACPLCRRISLKMRHVLTWRRDS
jgi:hypothetical protein